MKPKPLVVGPDSLVRASSPGGLPPPADRYDGPMVSFIVPVFNREREVRKLIESLGSQTYTRTEIIIVDDGSTDNSAQVSIDTLKRLNLSGKVFRNRTNIGRQISRDTGLAHASGDFVWFLDSDMVIPSKATESCVAASLAEDLDGLMIPERSTGTGIWARCRALEKRVNDFDLPKMSIRFVRREIALAIGGHVTNHVADDYDFHNRAVRRGVRYRLLSETHIIHKEVESVKEMLWKYYGYGRSMLLYARMFPAESFQQFFPFRSAYLRSVRILAESPLITFTFFALKALQYSVALLGVLSSVVTGKKTIHADESLEISEGSTTEDR